MHKSWSQKAILNIVKLKELYTDFMKRIKEQKRQIIEIKLFKIDEKVYLWINNM